MNPTAPREPDALAWLPRITDWRGRIAAARGTSEPAERALRLAALAQHRLGLVETIQLARLLSDLPVDATSGLVPLRVAIVSSSTADHLAAPLRVAGLRRGLRIAAHTGGYAQFRHEALGASPAFESFAPQVVVFALHADEWITGIALDASAADAGAALDAGLDELRTLWRAVRERLGAMLVQQTFLDRTEPLFGSFDRRVAGAPVSLVAALNAKLTDAAAADGVALLDLAAAAARDGLDIWFDAARWLQGKMEVSPSAAPAWGELASRVVAALLGRTRKCLVLDLDNTLWGGVVGEVGTAGLVLGEGSALGEAHLALQRHAKRLAERGVILAVCSKNDPAIAEAAFREHPEMLLRRDDIAVFVANWNDKAANLEAIAAQLNIGLDSLVFVDDHPAERARVREALPMVAVPELPDDPAGYVRCLAASGCFEAVSFTAEDRTRSAAYAADSARETLRGRASSIDDYLRGLEMEADIAPAAPVDLERVLQLLNKTNQFNTTTRRYTADELAARAAASDGCVLRVRLTDRFGDNGLVAVLIGVPAGPGRWEIENWVMSCRVFGRRLEHETLNAAVEIARAAGVEMLAARFVPTPRNGVIAALYAELGFAPDAPVGDAGGESRWRLALAEHRPHPTAIRRRSQPT